MAWFAAPLSYLTSPKNMDSLAMTARLSRVLYESGCRRIVGAGTCIEYGLQDRPMHEGDPVEPRTLYAASKRAAYLALDALARQTTRELVWARIFHLHGPGDAEVRLIPAVVRRLANGEPIDLSDGLQLRDHLHVADAGRAIAALAEGEVLGPVNVCSGDPVTLRRVVEAAAAVVGRPDLLRFGARPRRPDDVAFLAGDASLLRSTGWTPRFGLADGVRDAVEWQLARLT
jgi:dTDP-6-deoxy-L-talose 4-dehydrogenase (NAD+)